MPEKASEEPESIRIRFSDLNAEDNDPFIIYQNKFMGIEDRRTGQSLTEKRCESLWTPVQT